MRNYSPAWFRRMPLLAGDKRLEPQRSCRDHPPLPISSASVSFYQMLCCLTRVVIGRRSRMVSTGAETPNSSGSYPFHILYLGDVMKTLKISRREIIKLCYGDCNCPLMDLVVYYSRLPVMELDRWRGEGLNVRGRNCRSYRANHRSRFGLVLIGSHDNATEAP